MTVPAELHYTPEHEWVAIAGTTASVGITDHAQRVLSVVGDADRGGRALDGGPLVLGRVLQLLGNGRHGGSLLAGMSAAGSQAGRW